MTAAQRIGRKLNRAMKSQHRSPELIAKRTGKQLDHVEKILAGYPNSPEGTTMLDTVDEIAKTLGLKLDLTIR